MLGESGGMALLRILLGVHGKLTLILDAHLFVILLHALGQQLLNMILQETFLNLIMNLL